jgi:K+-sensing histidine kinase KdpD
MAIVAMISGVVAGLLAFIIFWMVADFFFPPRNRWIKSGFVNLIAKFGLAAGVAFVVFAFVSNWILNK